MRHLLSLLALSLFLAACGEDATTAPVVDTIPGPPNAPRLTVTVLTGTKAAPVDSPTVRVQWWYKDSVRVGSVGNHQYIFGAYNVVAGIRDTTMKFGCYTMDSLSIVFSVVSMNGATSNADSVIVHCR